MFLFVRTEDEDNEVEDVEMEGETEEKTTKNIKQKEQYTKEEPLSSGEQSIKYLSPEDVRVHLREMWKNESTIMASLFGCMKTSTSPHPTDVFFITCLVVIPSRFRPVSPSSFALQYQSSVGEPNLDT